MPVGKDASQAFVFANFSSGTASVATGGLTLIFAICHRNRASSLAALGPFSFRDEHASSVVSGSSIEAKPGSESWPNLGEK